ncbi:hypothetical protein [Paenarthrobacter nicotinovorans]|uniref:hypothetical protein n=1 Tax=Paenarthrobacter nicotinovorans TaxID=29320 RepID=UPI00325FED5E
MAWLDANPERYIVFLNGKYFFETKDAKRYGGTLEFSSGGTLSLWSETVKAAPGDVFEVRKFPGSPGDPVQATDGSLFKIIILNKR